MSLLVAFLIAFGIVAPNTRYAASLTDTQAKELIKKNNLIYAITRTYKKHPSGL